ncbi:MAG: hypothetical protein KKA05_07500 [Alphaproteobacteria bacterium]|nr:hypothetical protein [Alphaproteobacteria bacterium]
MLIFIGVWVFFMRGCYPKKGEKTQLEYLQAIEDLTALQVKALDRIADALESKKENG